MRKIPLARYRVGQVPRSEMEKTYLRHIHPDYRSSGDMVLTGTLPGGTQLVSVTQLPDNEIVGGYVSALRETLQQRARAQDLSLYEQNPDDPDGSILFADAEILFRTQSGWTLDYVQPGNFDTDELTKASKFAQVVAAMHPRESAEDIVAVLHSPLSYSVWKKLEKEKRILRDDEGNVTVLPPKHRG